MTLQLSDNKDLNLTCGPQTSAETVRAKPLAALLNEDGSVALAMLDVGAISSGKLDAPAGADYFFGFRMFAPENPEP